MIEGSTAVDIERSPGSPSLVVLAAVAITWLLLLEAVVAVAEAIPSPAWIGTLHTAGAGVLLLLVLATTVVALAQRRSAPRRWPPALAAFAVLLVTAALGMLFATGALPLALAPIQYALLAATVLLLLVLLRRARGSGASSRALAPPS